MVAVGPDVSEYGLSYKPPAVEAGSHAELSPTMVELARQFSRADEGNVYFEAHVEYLQRLLEVSFNGGSIVCDGSFAQGAVEQASRFPQQLFETLDTDWQHFVTRASKGELGLVVPPVLAIVLSRCARRDAIPLVLRDLRNEWAQARAKLWDLLDALKKARTLGEANDIGRQLQEASHLLSPERAEPRYVPTTVLWDLATGAGFGALAGLAAGSPNLGALTGAIAQAANVARQADLNVLFRCGAFDLARRVRQELLYVEPNSLSRILTEAERRTLGT